LSRAGIRSLPLQCLRLNVSYPPGTHDRWLEHIPAQPVETTMPIEKTSEKKEEKQGKAPKEKKGTNRKTPQSDRYWYDPDCGPVYPD
jgi:hypothetical protein